MIDDAVAPKLALLYALDIIVTWLQLFARPFPDSILLQYRARYAHLHHLPAVAFPICFELAADFDSAFYFIFFIFYRWFYSSALHPMLSLLRLYLLHLLLLAPCSIMTADMFSCSHH